MISTILDLVDNSLIPFRDDRLTVSEQLRTCDNYTIYGLDCNLVAGAGVFAQIVWEPIRYFDEIEGAENLLGEFIPFYKKKVGFMSFSCVVNDELLSVLQEVTMQETQQIRDLVTNEIFNIDSMTISSSNQSDVILAIVEFRVFSKQGGDSAISITTACCGSLYAGAPFEPCDPDGGPPPTPSECLDFSVGISITALPAILATSTGGPGGLATYQWFLDENNDGNFEILVSETAQGLNVTLPGTYRVQVSQGGCSGVADFLYNDPCGVYALSLTFEGGLLIAEPNFPVSAYAWYKPGLILDPADTDNVYLPTESGLFTVRVTDVSCGVVEATFNVVLGEDCAAFTYNLVRVDNVLEIQSLGPCAGAITYFWQIDRGDGNGFVVIAGATESTLIISEVGLYKSSVNCDSPACNTIAQILVLDNCVQFKGWIAGIVPKPGVVEFTAASSSAPAGALINYTWYEWINENWQLLGTGVTMTIPDTSDPANIKLIVAAGQCVREDFTHDCVDPSAIEPYQAFYADAPMQTEFIVLAFTFVQPYDQGGSFTSNQIGARYLIERNGLIQKHLPLADMATTNEQNTYSYDFADNKLIFPTNNPLFIGDRVSATDTQP